MTTLVSGEATVCNSTNACNRSGILSNGQSINIDVDANDKITRLQLVRGLGDTQVFESVGKAPKELRKLFLELHKAPLGDAKGKMQVNDGAPATIHHLVI